MRITKEQQYALSTLRCERLSSNDDNFRLIEDFYNTKNSNIVDALQNDAYREDMDGELAYYLVKDKDDDILFFFSLKCGVLYDEFLEDEELVNYYKTNLNFHDSDEHNTAIPLYDFACKFMCQETKGLNDAIERFYNYFNNDKGYVLFPDQQY